MYLHWVIQYAAVFWQGTLLIGTIFIHSLYNIKKFKEFSDLIVPEFNIQTLLYINYKILHKSRNYLSQDFYSKHLVCAFMFFFSSHVIFHS